MTVAIIGPKDFSPPTARRLADTEHPLGVSFEGGLRLSQPLVWMCGGIPRQPVETSLALSKLPPTAFQLDP
jgi:hypothetical protein